MKTNRLKYSLITISFVLISTICFGQNTNFSGFMDVNSKYDDATETFDFNLGAISTYITSDITDNISFLNENTLGIKPNGEYKVGLERAIIKYTVDNYLNFSIGKFHSPASYWNITYHHGRVLQQTTTLPLFFQNRIIDRHTTGFMISGDFISEKNFAYRFLIGNGLGSTAFKDNDRTKSITMQVQFDPIKDATFFAAAYYDRISSNVPNRNGTLLTENVNQNLYSAGLIYHPTDAKFELLSEFFIVKNDIKSLATKWNSSGYFYVGYSLKKLTPYYRLDHVNITENDPYFVIDKISGHTLGLRYNFSYLARVNVEYQNTRRDVGQNMSSVRMQFAVGF